MSNWLKMILLTLAMLFLGLMTVGFSFNQSLGGALTIEALFLLWVIHRK